jgi:glycosyltransferase involved in cell wall biosynthesis
VGQILKILFLSFYFEPDLCAGSFRAAAMARALVEADSALELDVLSTQPNRYVSFAVAADRVEQRGRLSVHRFELPRHSSGMRDQSQSFLSYARQVLWHVRSRRYDAVLATSSRLMTAALASVVARWKGLPLYLDVRDIFVDTIGDVLPARVARCAAGPFDRLEHWTMIRAQHINLVSEGFRDYFVQRYPQVPLTFFTNGIDDEFIGIDVPPPRTAGNITEVLYAGNIGEGQGLHLIVPALAERLPNFRFRIIGDGGRVGALRDEITRRGLGNVLLEPPVKRSELISASLRSDILFLHLNDYPAFRKVLPSKLFEYGALGKPVWAGVAGYAADFVRTEITNSAVFSPCDAEDAVRSLTGLRLADTPRPAFVRRFARREITNRLAADILGTLARGAGDASKAAAHTSP